MKVIQIQTFYITESTTGKTNKRLFPTHKVSLPLNTNTVPVTEEPATNGEINTNYVLAGGGILIGLFLFVLILQIYTCKRSKFTRTNTISNKKEDVVTSALSGDDVKYKKERTLRVHPKTRSNIRIQRPAESVYHDVEESLEIRHSPVISNTSQEYEMRCHLPRCELSYSPLSIKDSVLMQQMNDKPVDSIGEFSGSIKSDLYLHPISVLQNTDSVAL